MVLRTIIDLSRSRRNLFLDYSDLQLQIKKLRRLVMHAYDNVPFYHARLKNAGIKPSDVRTINDLDNFPLTTRALTLKYLRPTCPGFFPQGFCASN